ncbi:MAG: magnesium chelatase subunit D family protein [Nocardioides sp.]|uniref:magnesium chelatase subunit D family protein n=1 Tax=Nocardioides sp. TaxID=35761 RepID=UPI0039E438B5
MPLHYPFTAVLGADPEATLEPMATALILSAVSPDVGGVLIRGEKGTAKSTLVRALAAVLPPIAVIAGDRFSSDPAEPAPLSPDGPFPADAATETRPVRLVELPVGATEDRVLGSLHLERALSAGTVDYEPGLLAKAHRGILYVDEVNLLHDHLVDVLLDAAAMGQVSVERDNVSVSHAARFVLIGTMNPEEGELRPQLLDRFGLSVEVAAPRDPAQRVEVVRRRIAFDADPAGVVAAYEDSERRLRARIVAAQDLLRHVQLSEKALLKIAEVCAAFEVDGLRADIVTARTAVAHAAWQGRDRVQLEDIRVAARLALPHRRRRNPFDAPGLDEDLLDQVLGDAEPDDPEPDPGSDDTPPGSDDSGHDSPTPETDSPAPGTDSAAPGTDSAAPGTDSAAPGTDSAAPGTDSAAPGTDSVVGSGDAYRARLFALRGVGGGEAGRRSRAVTSTGRQIGAARPDGTTSVSIQLVETVRAAAPYQRARGRGPGGRVLLHSDDLRTVTREGRESNLVLFCVDASGSMAARKRMTQVKTAVLSLLLDAYRRRDKVGLVTFRGASAELALPPTGSVEIAARRLDELPAGGRTPLAEGLCEAARVLELERVRDPRRRPLLVVLTDGRATHGPDAVARSRLAAAGLARTGVGAVVIDCESGPMRFGLARGLAAELGAEHVPVAEVSAQVLTDAVRERVA